MLSDLQARSWRTSSSTGSDPLANSCSTTRSMRATALPFTSTTAPGPRWEAASLGVFGGEGDGHQLGVEPGLDAASAVHVDDVPWTTRRSTTSGRFPLPDQAVQFLAGRPEFSHVAENGDSGGPGRAPNVSRPARTDRGAAL